MRLACAIRIEQAGQAVRKVAVVRADALIIKIRNSKPIVADFFCWDTIDRQQLCKSRHQENRNRLFTLWQRIMELPREKLFVYRHIHPRDAN